jgi:hypothetical protein
MTTMRPETWGIRSISVFGRIRLGCDQYLYDSEAHDQHQGWGNQFNQFFHLKPLHLDPVSTPLAGAT